MGLRIFIYWSSLILASLISSALILFQDDPALAQSSTTPDKIELNLDLEADNIVYDTNGIAYAKGNVIITSNNMIQNEIVKIEANDIVFDKNTFDLKVFGDVRITITPSAILLQGKDFHFNGTENTGSMKNVSGRIPGFTQPRFKLSFDNFYLDNAKPIIDFDNLSTQYLQVNDELYVYNANLVIQPNKLTKFELVLNNAIVTNTRRKETDLKLLVKKIIYIPNRRVLLKGVSPVVENQKLFTFPKYSKSFAPQNRAFSWSTPKFSQYDATGWNIHLTPNFYYNGTTFNFPITYSEKLDLLGGINVLVPLNNGKAGFFTAQAGKSLNTDVDSNPVLVTDLASYSYAYGQNVDIKPINWWVIQLDYGNLAEEKLHRDINYPRLQTRRFAINANLALDPIRVHKNVQLVTRFGTRHIEYSYTNRDLNEFFYQVQLQNKQRIGTSYISYTKRLRTANTGMLIDTNSPDSLLSGSLRFRMNQNWLGQLHSYYNLRKNEFDTAQFSATKLMKSYAVTFSYDFVRNTPLISFELRGKDYYNPGRQIEPDNDILKWPINEDNF